MLTGVRVIFDICKSNLKTKFSEIYKRTLRFTPYRFVSNQMKTLHRKYSISNLLTINIASWFSVRSNNSWVWYDVQFSVGKKPYICRIEMELCLANLVRSFVLFSCSYTLVLSLVLVAIAGSKNKIATDFVRNAPF